MSPYQGWVASPLSKHLKIPEGSWPIKCANNKQWKLLIILMNTHINGSSYNLCVALNRASIVIALPNPCPHPTWWFQIKFNTIIWSFITSLENSSYKLIHDYCVGVSAAGWTIMTLHHSQMDHGDAQAAKPPSSHKQHLRLLTSQPTQSCSGGGGRCINTPSIQGQLPFHTTAGALERPPKSWLKTQICHDMYDCASIPMLQDSKESVSGRGKSFDQALVPNYHTFLTFLAIPVFWKVYKSRSYIVSPCLQLQ